MNLTPKTYTTEITVNILPGTLLFFPSDIELIDTSSAETWPSLRIEYPHPINKEEFVGILSDQEASAMKKEIDLFKKRFDDDLARRHKILFGE